MAQMPGSTPRNFTKEDLEDPKLSRLNEHLLELTNMSNILAGAHGPVPFTVPVDLQGNEVRNAKVPGIKITAPAPVTNPGEVALGNQTTATATAGGGVATPGTVAGFLTISIGGKLYKLPYFLP